MIIGFIGAGSMGTILIEAFIESGTVPPAHHRFKPVTGKNAHACQKKRRSCYRYKHRRGTCGGRAVSLYEAARLPYRT